MTRLRYESDLHQNFPELPWIRAYTSGEFEITIYACDSNLELSDDTKTNVLDHLKHHGMASCHHKVKHYFELNNDNIFPIGEIPDAIKTLALTSGVTHKGVQDCLIYAFPMLDEQSIKTERNIVHISPKNGFTLTVFQVDFLERLIAEVLPMGSVAKITKKPYVSEQD